MCWLRIGVKKLTPLTLAHVKDDGNSLPTSDVPALMLLLLLLLLLRGGAPLLAGW